MKKKILSAFLCLAVVIATVILLPAETNAATSGYYTYSVSGGKATITSVSGQISGTATIPSYIDNYPVTTIAMGAFHGRNNITSVIIPDTVTTIEEAAFYACLGLTSVTIGSGVKSMGRLPFESCSKLTEIHVQEENRYFCSDAKGVVFDKEKEFLYFAPYGITGSYTIPDGVISIRDSAFYGCAGLTSVTIPDSVLYISMEAFLNCTGLTDVTIGNSLRSIGPEAFYYCTSLTGFWVDEGNPFFSNDARGVLYNKDKSSLLYAHSGINGSYTIPDGVTSIGDSAFHNCNGLTSVTIPDGVTSIGASAFCRCNGLTSVTIGNGVTSIGENAFRECTGLTSVTIPDGVTTIEHGVFNGCNSLTDIAIPDSVTSIGWYAFCECSSLTSFTIGDSITSIGNYAFFRCSDLTSVTIGNGVTSIGDSAFHNCNGLTSVTIGKGVTSIGGYAFSYCNSLTDVYYTGTQEQWDAITVESNNDCLLSANITVNDASHICTEYKQWVVIKEPTFTTTGEKHLVCLKCGEILSDTEVVDMLVGEVVQWNVAVADDLQVKFYLEISQSIAYTAKVRVYVGELGYTFPVSRLDKSEDGLYMVQVGAAAAQMNDFIYISVINGGCCSQPVAYTIRQYADAILADEAHSKYHAVVKQMLNYGAAAQAYFDYETGSLGSVVLPDVGTSEIPDSVDNEVSVSGSVNGLSFYGASLVFRDRISVRYYFSPESLIDNLNFTANGEQYIPQLKDGRYYVEVSDILPQNLDQPIVLSVADEDGNVLNVSYNPMNYIVRMNEKGSAELKALVKALYNYHLAAKAMV